MDVRMSCTYCPGPREGERGTQEGGGERDTNPPSNLASSVPQVCCGGTIQHYGCHWYLPRSAGHPAKSSSQHMYTIHGGRRDAHTTLSMPTICMSTPM